MVTADNPGVSGVLGIHPCGVCTARWHQRWKVVHPRVVRFQLPQTNQPERKLWIDSVTLAQPQRLGDNFRCIEVHKFILVPNTFVLLTSWLMVAENDASLRRCELLRLNPPRRNPYRSP